MSLRVLLVWVSALLGFGCGTAARVQRVALLEDRRALGELPTLARDEAPEVRARALRAVGRLQQRGSVEPVRSALRDTHTGVRCEAARAAGLLGLAWDGRLAAHAAEALTSALLEAERAEGAGPCRGVQLEALGRLGTQPALAHLAEVLKAHGGKGDVVPADAAQDPGGRTSTQGDEEHVRRAALALGVALKRTGGEGAPAGVVEALSAQLPTLRSEEGRFAAAYALRLVRGPGPLPALRGCLADGAEEVRAVCVRGVGERAEDADLPRLGTALGDPSPFVAVQAVRALAQAASKCAGMPCAPLEVLAQLRVRRLERAGAPGAYQPFLALFQAKLPPEARPLLVALRGALENSPAVLDCRAAAALDRLDGRLVESRTCGRGEIQEPLRLRLALGELAQSTAEAQARAATGLSLRSHPDAGVRAAALGLVGESGWKEAARAVRSSLADGDPVVASTAAAVLARLGDSESGAEVLALAESGHLPQDVWPVLAEALGGLRPDGAEAVLRRWLQAPAPALRLAAAEALKRDGAEPPEVPAIPHPDASPLRPLAAGAQLELVTNRGTIVVALDTEEAPRTAAAIAALAEAGFYDGLTLHRVVPDFVAQGGDPRGDGEGGPGHTLRCELNAHPYTRGTVGMALSGPDTGGSQFFFTHSAQPHLDGRYTAFGQVVSGQDVVDSLLEGDTWRRVRVRQ
jgi:cyclophilin family peptidyl-prolyl cis-trans isomerase